MFIKRLLPLSLILIANPVFAFTCYFTLAKDSCWINYDVTVNVLDASDNSQVTSINVPKGKSWNRQKFECQPGQKFMYSASFTPAFWENEKGATYEALQYWTLPATIASGTSAWELPVCYPKAFSEVPLPPTAGNDCQCSFKEIPPIPEAVIKK